MKVGQGRPQTSCRGPVRSGRGALGAARCCAPILLGLALATLAQAGDSIRVRVAWGGTPARLWRGSIGLTEGTPSELRPLGIEADEPGSMWLDGPKVMIREPSGRLYDGFDVLLDAPADRAKLRVRLAAEDDKKPPVVIEIPLADVLKNSVSTDLDDKGTRLLVRRTPGDALRVEFDRRHLIFAPGEFFSLRVRPNLLDAKSRDHRRLRVQLRPARIDVTRSDEVIWEQDTAVDDVVSMPVPLQVKEGVYDVDVSIVEMPGFQLRSVGAAALRLKKKIIAERKVQLLVLDVQSPEQTGQPETLRTVTEIDPASPKWWEKFSKPSPSLARLQLGSWRRLWQGPLGSGDMQSREHPLGKLAQLGPSGMPADVSWEAYTLPIEQPDQPHVLEVEYPSDVPQQLGISVVEPNSAGAIMPIQLDSGVSVSDEMLAVGEPAPRMLRHRLIFWPHTKAPLVLITNRSSTRPAVYGKIRLLDGWSRLPSAKLDLPSATVDDQTPRRLLAAYFDRPLFTESFCATEAYDVWNRRSLDDWLTFYQGGTRLVEYLQHVGMNGTMISVLSEGGSLYPSQLVEPTPRHDTGPFFDSGQDPVRKDVLEMLLRVFDRHKMRLIAAMEFGAPLPELERLLRAGGSEGEGIRWIGPEGLAWEQVYRPYRRQAPYYNLLDPRVQTAVLGVVRELVDNYARGHESFAGVAIQLAGWGYGQLPGPEWGMDDATIARFERETGLRIPVAQGPGRFRRRHEFLAGPGRHAWIKWRCDCLARFYHHMQSELSAVRPGARLYLTTANLLAGPYWEARLRPTLSRPVTMGDLLLDSGIDAAQFCRPEGPVLVQAARVAPLRSPDTRAVELAIGELMDSPEDAKPTCRSSMCFHPAAELRLESFDAKSPYRPSYTVLHSQLAPSGDQNRRRFIRELAARDPEVIFDGGRLLPMGQEDALGDLVAIYRRLPAIAMRRLEVAARGPSIQPAGTQSPPDPASGPGTQPVTIRYGADSGKTYIYAVNDSPVPVSLGVQVVAGPEIRLEPLVDGKPAGELVHSNGKTVWRVELAPYGLVAARLPATGVTFSSPEVSLPRAIHDTLAARIRELGDRLGDLRIPPPLGSLGNPQFEEPAGAGGAIAGWTVSKAENGSAKLERDAKRPNSPQAVRLTSSGANLSLLSRPFSPPPTGRLSMFVWLKVPQQQKQPLVELVFEGRLYDEPFVRAGVVGRGVDGYPAKPISEDWRQFVFLVNDLPLEGLSDLQVGVRLMGAGEVWVDDVELRHLEFTPDEMRQLYRLLSSAQTKLDANQISDCLRVLEGYWPCFLERNVPLRTSVARQTPLRTEPTQNPASKKPASPGFLERMRKLTPRKLW